MNHEKKLTFGVFLFLLNHSKQSFYTHVLWHVSCKIFKKSNYTHLNMENPLLFPHLSYVCMVCMRARVKASNLAYYGNWGRSKSCTLTGCCRSWLLPQTPKPLTINTTFLNYVVLPLVFWWPTWLYNYYM